MKKLWKYLIALALLAVAAAVTGCTQWDPVYKHLNEDGYTVSVRFDANGGEIAGQAEAVVDVFKLSDFTPSADGKISIRVLDLSDEARETAGTYTLGREDYFFAGWYVGRTPRVNENGEAVDEYGALVSQSGRPQGYSYERRWDFDKDRLEVDVTREDLSSYTPELTLYAAWIPNINYDFYAQKPDGTFEKLPVGADKPMEVKFPVWNEATGKLDMNNVPKRNGMTFLAAFMDEALTVPVPASLKSTDYVDYTHGVCLQGSVSVYTTWKEGTWYRIQTADQLSDIGDPNGSYELLADLDFTDVLWPNSFSKTEFKGTILGGGHIIRNVKVTQGDPSQDFGGLFGALGETSVVRDVTFENITFSLQAGSRKPEPVFGTFAGILRENAQIINVSFGGTLEIGSACAPHQAYEIGLLFGRGTVPADLSHENVTYVLSDPEQNTTRFEFDAATGQGTLVFAD